ncbi:MULTISPECIES: hypothetical protein [unclassified Nocardia]|uniref:hypothetical protein n=1 Tax=unclassified Nocardia TaxID=2637762 RepID=UPI00278C1546|nr:MULTISPECIES: hypothetical protein [unclassified Nocardia]
MQQPNKTYEQIITELNRQRGGAEAKALQQLHENLENLDAQRAAVTDPGQREQLDRLSNEANSLLGKAIEDLRHPTILSPHASVYETPDLTHRGSSQPTEIDWDWREDFHER